MRKEAREGGRDTFILDEEVYDDVVGVDMVLR